MSFMETTRAHLHVFFFHLFKRRESEKDILGCFMAHTRYSVKGRFKANWAQPQSEKLVGVPRPGLRRDTPRAAGRPVGRLQAPIAALYPSQLLGETSN